MLFTGVCRSCVIGSCCVSCFYAQAKSQKVNIVGKDCFSALGEAKQQPKPHSGFENHGGTNATVTDARNAQRAAFSSEKKFVRSDSRKGAPAVAMALALKRRFHQWKMFEKNDTRMFRANFLSENAPPILRLHGPCCKKKEPASFSMIMLLEPKGLKVPKLKVQSHAVGIHLKTPNPPQKGKGCSVHSAISFSPLEAKSCLLTANLASRQIQPDMANSSAT